MGLSPSEVDGLSLWQFASCMAGFQAAHGGKKKAGVDPDDPEVVEQMRRMGVKGF